ncbi:MAG: UTP--glucose-1-phosphate uridylyltransferase [Nitrospirota bacterium]
MSNDLIETIVSDDDSLRNRSINALLENRTKEELLVLADEMEGFRKSTGNLYHKVRASLFLFVIYRFYLQKNSEVTQYGTIPFEGIKSAFDREFEKSIEFYLSEIKRRGEIDSAISSAVADSYYKLSFKYLLDQVKLSISQCNENHHLYNIRGLDDYPFSVPDELLNPDRDTGNYPAIVDASPVRLDPSHSGWSDIFFLGMDFPEGARVINLSVDLRVHGSGEPILPPCECYCRYIEEPVIDLVSIDLKSSKKIATLQELFNFGNDYLSLLKAGVVASGLIPPCLEQSDISLTDILQKLMGRTGGIELVTKVNGIPKGSRLAVSTTLLSTIITSLMRFSGQIKNLTGPIQEDERRVVASRAILGEWLGGSGGGWQDSGGLWPGIKVIKGRLAEEGHPEYGISRGCLLPEHNVFTREEISEEVEERILKSIVLVHGGISQDVGPILEMVTEKYLLKYEKEWEARLKGIQLFDMIVDALKAGDMKELGRLTTEDWEESIQKVIPAVNNSFTEDLIRSAKEEFGDDYRGFLMLGGMSGGGMAFIINPDIKEEFKKRIALIMLDLKRIYASSFPFIIDPVVYDFRLNNEGVSAKLLKGRDAIMPGMGTVSNFHPPVSLDEEEIKEKYGFDEISNEQMKSSLKKGDIGLAKNRLPASVKIDDVSYDEILHFEDEENKISDNDLYQEGIKALRNNEIAVVSFAGGMGSRWTHGSAVVKPINPFIRIGNRYRTFLEIHLAKSRKTGTISGQDIPHVFTTSYLTHNAIETYLEKFDCFRYQGKVYLSPAKSIGQRVYPMERDLRFYWEEQLQQKLDDNVQKVQDDVHNALIAWAKRKGEGENYSENRPLLRFNPPGHWYEIPNLLKNGVLAEMLKDNQGLKYLLCHNIDTLGANIEPDLLGIHIKSNQCITFEVIPRRIEDAGGGLAKINGHIQLVEGMSLPKDEDEFKLSYYNTLTNWITIDALLKYFGLNRDIIIEAAENPDKQKRIILAIQSAEKRIPAYVTIKNVKYLWGSGQEDVYPVAQFEKLWGDMTGLDDLDVNYVSVSRYRGLQLKEPALLDMWRNDGSFEYVKSKCVF